MKNQRLLVIGAVWVSPKASAAGARMLQLITCFLERGVEVIFATAAQENPHAFSLASLGVTELSIALNDDNFDKLVAEINPTLVMYDRFTVEEQFGWRVRSVCPQALQILDTEDLHCLRLARQEALKRQSPFQVETLYQSEVAQREIASIFRCDLSLIISSVEMDILQKYGQVPKTLLYELPFMVPSVATSQMDALPTFEERSDFVFIGNYKHAPNIDAVQQLKNDIWPKIAKHIPNTSLHIYGAFAPQQIHEFHQPKEGFIVKGYAEEVGAIFSKARLLLAPLRFGAGQKGKILDAMCFGLPTITTPIGAEGMHYNLPWCGAIANSTDEFVRQALEHYTQKEVWNKAQQHGFALVNSQYAKEVLAPRWIAHLEQLQEKLSEHRAQNFIGAMLQHHTLQSTKYLSKWIMEKQKRLDEPGSF